jgi:hypothetical protein
MQEFVVTTTSGARYAFPFSRAEPPPCKNDRVATVFVDAELGNEAFTYLLESGNEGSVHLDHVREYNEEPQFMADLLLYNLTLEAEERAADSALSRRQIARQLNTSVPQLYRLLDPTNYNKSMKQLVALLHLLDCDVDLVVKKRKAA